MFSFTSAEQQTLQNLGARLEAQRLAKNETQQVLAARLGISIPTYRKMIHGDPNVKVGYWIQAVNLRGSLQDFETILQAKSSLFSERESQSIKPDKQRRVRRKRSVAC